MRKQIFLVPLCAALLMAFLSGCAQTIPETGSQPSSSVAEPEGETVQEEAGENGSEAANPVSSKAATVRTGLVPEQVLEGETGTIHYSYYLPEDYDPQRKYPLMMSMPGYDMMWFGEGSSGSNLNWRGFRCWTELPEDMIVVSAQLTDWRETSASQAIELTEYFIDNFSVDPARIYTAGYSAGGVTMSHAVALRPDLYAAYLHGVSQWDGDYAPIAENGVAVYIFMAENDEYYGSARAREAYQGLHDAYTEAGWSEDGIDDVLQLQTPDNAWFAERGVIRNYHGGGNVVFDEEEVLTWIISHTKSEETA